MSNSNIYHNDDNNNSSNTTANNSDVDPKIKEQCKQTITKSLKRTYQLFEPNRGALPNPDFASQRLRLSVKIQGEYKALAQPLAKQLIDSQQKQPLLIQNQQQRLALTYTAPDQRQDAVAAAAAGNVAGPHPYPNAPGVTLSPETQAPASDVTPSQIDKLIQSLPPEQRIQTGASVPDITGSSVQVYKPPPTTAMILKQKAKEVIKPKWHAPWKLMRVISGHQGWVRTVAVDTSNEWFATGATDRTIKIWDLASGTLKLTLTGHISAVRAIVISDRHPYMFSVGEDKMIKCWDLEQNKVVRQYHGHLSGIYCAAMHPTLDLLVTGGRDSTARVWDIRTKTQVHVLSGHRDAVASVVCQSTDPQIITGSHDSTIRLWDVAAGKTMAVLTNHKKSVRALAIHPSEYTFVSASPDNIKKWKCPEGQFMMNFSGHNSMINSVAINNDNVLVSAGDNGSMYFWDWKSGYNFQQTETVAQPGSLDSEQGIFATCFDHSGSRLITGEADKTIKVWREDPNATEETHPINFNPDLKPKRY